MDGWKLQVERRDGSTYWAPLKDLKASNPVELEWYTINNNIELGLDFCWWVRDVVKKRYHIIGKVANKYWKTSHKFGIRGELLHIDKETGTDFWRRSIENKMLNLKYTFQGEEGLTTEETRKGKVIIRFQDIKCHLIFDIKLDGKLTRKARFVF